MFESDDAREDQQHRERLEAIRAVTAGMAQAKRNENEL
jgi:hypothetical protein